MNHPRELWELAKFIIVYLLMICVLGYLVVKYLAPSAHAADIDWHMTSSFTERRSPARLSDCPAATTIVINYSSGVVMPWQSFCYWGRG